MVAIQVMLVVLGQTGVPVDGFPNWAERTLLVFTNRARADPAAALASCASSGCPDANCYSPSQPLVWDLDLNHSARFHVANLVAAGSQLQHPSPCLLVSNIASLYPTSCDGSPSCACQGGQSLCGCDTCSCDTTSSSCVTQPFDRITQFNPAGCAENIAAGYSDPQTTFDGWLTETCSSWNGSCAPPTQSTCSSVTENGHRFNILDPTNQIMGAGDVVSQTDPCYPGEWDSQDYGCGTNPTIPKLVAGSHFPQSGTSLTFWANWYDSAAPSSAQVDVDGTCNTMSVDRGSGGNATYTWLGTLASGCHSYVFSFTDPQGASWLVPETGAYQAGDSCTEDYIDTAPQGCGGAATTSSSSTSATGSVATSGRSTGRSTAGTTGGSTGTSTTAASTSGGGGATTVGGSGGSVGSVATTSGSSTGVGTPGTTAASSTTGRATHGTTGAGTTSAGKTSGGTSEHGGGCSCSTGAFGDTWVLGVVLLGFLRRRRGHSA